MNGDAILPAICAHLAAALDAPHPRYRPWRVDGHALGLVDDARAERLAAFDDVFAVTDDAVTFVPGLVTESVRSEAMARVARALRAAGELPAWRDELYAVAPSFDAPMAFALERGAARWFGIRTYAAHVNGCVAAAEGMMLWFARRSAAKAIDPGMLDNLVGGGIAAGATVADTVVRESWEEAGIPAAIARTAQPHGALRLRRAFTDGLQDETIYVHDLALAAEFQPANQDGEAVEHRLVDLRGAAALIAARDGPDVVTVDASLDTLDFLLRPGTFAATAARADAAALRDGLAATP